MNRRKDSNQLLNVHVFQYAFECFDTLPTLVSFDPMLARWSPIFSQKRHPSSCSKLVTKFIFFYLLKKWNQKAKLNPVLYWHTFGQEIWSVKNCPAFKSKQAWLKTKTSSIGLSKNYANCMIRIYLKFFRGQPICLMVDRDWEK